MYVGELVFTYIYDIGGEVRLQEAARLLTQVPEAERVEPRKSAPAYVALARPLLYRYPTRTLDTDHGVLHADIEARIHSIGAVSVSIRIPYTLPTLEAVNALTFLKLPDGYTPEAIAKGLAQEIESSVKPAIVETYAADVEPETYLVVAIREAPLGAMEIYEKEAQTLAGLLAGEKRPERLSQGEVRDNLRSWYRYYDDDLVVIDWDRAVLVEPTGKYDDVLAVMEATNLELLELRVYDRYLDQVLEEAYNDLTRFYGRGGLFRSARGVQEELSNARIDLVRVTDQINNIGKIFGDYYLAKLHVGFAQRFHLHEWETIVREKMATLNELYTLASHEVEHRRGIVLESMIVLLFVVDLVLIWLVSGA